MNPNFQGPALFRTPHSNPKAFASKQKNKRFNSFLGLDGTVTDPHLYLLVIARARGCGKLCRPDLDFLLFDLMLALFDLCGVEGLCFLTSSRLTLERGTRHHFRGKS